MKILFIGVNPKDVKQLRLQEEINIIKDIIDNAPNLFELKVRNAATKKSMIQYLNNFKPDILHISGHGNEDQTLVFEDEEGYSENIYTIQLGNLLDNYYEHLKCIIISACYSLNDIDSFSERIRYVVGMNTQIPNSTAKEFTQSFYQTLVSTESIEQSFAVARDAINLGLKNDLNILKLQVNGQEFAYSHKSIIKVQKERALVNWKLVVGIMATIIVMGYLLFSFYRVD